MFKYYKKLVNDVYLTASKMIDLKPHTIILTFNAIFGDRIIKINPIFGSYELDKENLPTKTNYITIMKYINGIDNVIISDDIIEKFKYLYMLLNLYDYNIN